MQYKKITSFNTTLAIAAALILVTSPALVVESVHAGEIELTDMQNAKLSRHKAKERVSRNEANKGYEIGDNDDSSSAEEEDCGTVDIGNVVNNKGFGGPKQIDVIITGDIINANNDCD